MADIKEKDLTILQACNGMITSDNKPVMSVVQKSIVFIYLLQCSQAVWVSVQERLAEHVPEKEKGNRECGFLWKRDKHVRFEISAPMEEHLGRKKQELRKKSQQDMGEQVHRMPHSNVTALINIQIHFLIKMPA